MTVESPQPVGQRFMARLEVVTDRQLFALTLLWVVVAGLVLQLLIMPYVLPFAHAGNGLIANLDAPGFHEMARQTAERMRTEGLKDFGVWIDGTINYPVAITAIFYLIYPAPWIQLPLNGVLFGITIIAVRNVLAVLAESRGVTIAALLPFFIFPSFVVIWGQPHRDLIAGAGFSLVLYALVFAAYRTGKAARLPALAILAAAGMGVMWLSRPYALSLVTGGTAVFVALALFSRQCRRLRLLTVAAAVLLAAFVNVRGWAEEIRARVDPSFDGVAAQTGEAKSPKNIPEVPASPIPADRATSVPGAPGTPPPVAQEEEPRGWTSFRLPRSRRVVSSTARASNCFPSPSGRMDTVLYNLCHVREGFIASALLASASSGYDYDIRLRSPEDFIAYTPRAMAFALLAPGPRQWGTERTTLGRLASLFVPFEMITAYTAFLLALVFGRRRLIRLNVWAVAAFCITYISFYALATPQLGGLYRMRAFAFAIVISTALAVALPRLLTPGGRASD